MNIIIILLPRNPPRHTQRTVLVQTRRTKKHKVELFPDVKDRYLS